jgi:hypothetical protein
VCQGPEVVHSGAALPVARRQGGYIGKPLRGAKKRLLIGMTRLCGRARAQPMSLESLMKSRLVTSAAALTVVESLFGVAAARADVVLLPDFHISYELVQNYSLTDPGGVTINNTVNGADVLGSAVNNTISWSVSNSQYGTVIDTINTQQPSIYAYATGNPYFSVAGTTLAYYFEIAGPNGNVAVDVAGHLSGYSNTVILANAGISITDYSYLLANGEYGGVNQSWTLSPYLIPPSETIDQEITFQTNEIYVVTLSVMAGEWGVGSVSSAYADPTFTIDPSVANADQYSISFSAGIGNGATATPEPASFALLATSLLGFGLIRRRRA